jgi:hypothetical protein
MNDSTHQTRTWRDNWFVVNWLTQSPFIGGFFKTTDVKEAFNMSGQYIFMLFGGALLMIEEALPTSMDQPPSERYTKMLTNMVIGMSAGGMFYNTILSAGKGVVSKCKRPQVASSSVLRATLSATGDQGHTDYGSTIQNNV